MALCEKVTLYFYLHKDTEWISHITVELCCLIMQL